MYQNRRLSPASSSPLYRNVNIPCTYKDIQKLIKSNCNQNKLLLKLINSFRFVLNNTPKYIINIPLKIIMLDKFQKREKVIQRPIRVWIPRKLKFNLLPNHL
ncbi:hypothetical protein FGO68_gene1713 [Halteria grandinella]|uniref:Uncharacterized protein n=1 Tax=Halteria grandinella TaxID=5974 RepID=A0A8J8NH47_HALGN|nr:hypothetical protein FGO68_gene1713 [Halteria grandinella]